MVGIFGFLDLTEGADIRTRADILLAAAKKNVHIPAGYHLFSRGAVGFAFPKHYSDTAWPIVSHDGLYALSVFGEIYLPDDSPLRANNFDERFLSPFLSDRSNFLRQLSGQFIFVLLSNEECVLVNDASGNFTMHYTQSDQRFVCSTSMMALRSYAPNDRFNERGLFEQLGIGQSLDGRTLFQDIHRLRRGTMISFTSIGLQSEEYISRDFHPAKDYRNELATVKNALTRAIERSARHNRVTAALSGGFDSRMTWSLILQLGLDASISASTHGLTGSRDLAIADRIAKRLHLKQDRIEFDQVTILELPSQWRVFVELTEGLFSLSQIFSYHAYRLLGSRFSVLIDSYGGALYRRQIKKIRERRIDMRAEIAPQVLPYELSPLYLSQLLRRDVRTLVFETSLTGLRDYYGTIEHIQNIGDKFDSYYADQTVPLRDSVSANMQMNFIGIEQPLLDPNALESVRRIPGPVRRREGIHKYIIRNAYQKLADFALDYSGYPAPYRGFSKLRLIAPGAESAIRKTSKLIPLLGRVSLRKPPTDARNVIEPGLALAKELLLTPHSEYDPLIDRAAIECTFRDMESGNYAVAPAIIQLLTYRMFLDIFF